MSTTWIYAAVTLVAIGVALWSRRAFPKGRAREAPRGTLPPAGPTEPRSPDAGVTTPAPVADAKVPGDSSTPPDVDATTAHPQPTAAETPGPRPAVAPLPGPLTGQRPAPPRVVSPVPPQEPQEAKPARLTPGVDGGTVSVRRRRRLTVGKREPLKRGGRIRGPLTRPPEAAPPLRESGDVAPGPELLRALAQQLEVTCRKREGTWQVVLVAEAASDEPMVLWQGDQRLRLESGAWILNSLDEDVRLEVPGHGSIVVARKVLWPMPLVLRLEGLEHAARARGQLRKGRYLILAPEGWRPQFVASARLLAEPEPTECTQYVVYPVALEGGDAAIEWDRPDGDTVPVMAGRPVLRLSGPVVEDMHPYQGPLFAPRAPAVVLGGRRSDKRPCIASLVVGEEGRLTRKRWKTEIRVGDLDEVDLEPTLQGRPGWYFVRAYDVQAQLVDSVDFRYVPGPVRQEPAADALGAQRDAGTEGSRVHLVHPPWFDISPADEGAQRCHVDSISSDRTAILVPTDPRSDRTFWYLKGSTGEAVALVIQVPRTWWGLATEGSLPAEWGQQAVALRMRDLSPSSKSILYVRSLPLAGKHVQVRSSLGEVIEYRFSEDGELVVRLRDFNDTWAKIAQDEGPAAPVTLTLLHAGSRYAVVLAEVRAVYACALCECKFESLSQCSEHLASHAGALFTKLNYEDARPHLDTSLPDRIYECGYCGYLVEVRRLEESIRNPTDGIARHIERECPKAANDHGRRQLRFRVVSDTGEIRERLELAIPDVYRCRRCHSVIKSRDGTGLGDHIVEKHLRELCVRD